MSLTTDRPAGPPEAPRIDPRIRQRRIAVRRDEGRRRLLRLLVALGVLLLVLLAALAVHSPLLDVDRVEVRGARSVDPAEVVSASGVDRGAAMLRLDVGSATERVAALPWIDEVEVRRDYPGTVEIVLTERTPAGVVAHGADEALVDRDGRVLGPVEARFDDLARLLVDEPLPGAGEVVAGADEALAVLAAVSDEIDRPAEVALDADGLRLELEDGPVAHLGAATRIDAKLRSLSTMLTQVDLACAARIDVSSPDRPVLTREDSC